MDYADAVATFCGPRPAGTPLPEVSAPTVPPAGCGMRRAARHARGVEHPHSATPATPVTESSLPRGRQGPAAAAPVDQWSPKAGSRCTRPFHARGSAAHPGSAG